MKHREFLPELTGIVCDLFIVGLLIFPSKNDKM
mgnify:CR=1 FL=1